MKIFDKLKNINYYFNFLVDDLATRLGRNYQVSKRWAVGTVLLKLGGGKYVSQMQKTNIVSQMVIRVHA